MCARMRALVRAHVGVRGLKEAGLVGGGSLAELKAEGLELRVLGGAFGVGALRRAGYTLVDFVAAEAHQMPTALPPIDARLPYVPEIDEGHVPHMRSVVTDGGTLTRTLTLN